MYHHRPYAVTAQQHRDESTLSSFQRTQLQQEETFYATFPEARVAKLAEQQYLMGAVTFHYDVRETLAYPSDPSHTGYIDNGYIAVGDNSLPSPKPPDPANSFIHNPSDYLHFDYGPNNAGTPSMFQSFPPIPNPILENGSLNSVVHGSDVLEYPEILQISEPAFPASPVPALEQAFYRASPQPILRPQEPVVEPCHRAPVPQQPAPFERAYAPDFAQPSAQGYFYPPPPHTPSDLTISPQTEHGNMQEGLFRAVVPAQHPRHHSIDAGHAIEHHRNQGRSTHPSSSHSRRNRDHHRHGHEHRLSRSHSHPTHPRQPEPMPQRGMSWVGSQPTPPGPSMPLSPLPSKRQLEKKPPLACLFCRGRKIACGPPMPGSPDKTCNQCQRRSLRCEYPAESRRGMRKKKATDPAGDDSTSVDKAHLEPDFSPVEPRSSDLPKPAA
ncbi:hypothetical protein M413DRAFT_172756 [Hebeloma cylindrosporum]|uniref:Zn(2)-C6 fungal-type domain-containing protein n=1 Tax=Hebeloma cylindrosporum TaxID=76867 RepID=A0A0C2XRF3_HEBCY|nr:hypothetical protein M413DRAFT_172756 [Hebeloma cylindrosporum h7]